MFKRIFLVFTIVSIFILTTASYAEYKGDACTNFAAVSGETVLFGNSEDASGDHPLKNNPDKTVIWFLPPAEGQYGMIQLGWYFEENRISYQGGMNEYGLCYDSTAIPEVQLNDHPEKTYNPSNSYKWRDIIGKCRTVEEAIAYVNDYNFGTMWFNLFLTDASGETVVVSPGKTGELVFDYIDYELGFMVQTNFNRSNPISHFGSYPDPRYDSAYSMLSEITESSSLSVQGFEEILEEVSQKGHEGYTPYSNIFDPVNQKAYIYFASQFNEPVVFDMQSELAKGEHEYMLKDLVTSETYEAGLEYHKSYLGKSRSFVVLAVIGVAAAVIVVGAISVFFSKRRRKRLIGR